MPHFQCLELSETFEEQDSPEQAGWVGRTKPHTIEGGCRAKPTSQKVQSQPAACSLQHGCRKQANAKPWVYLRKKPVCEKPGFLLLYPHIIQKLWLSRTPG